MRWKTFPCALVGRRDLSSSIYELEFRRDDGTPLAYVAGQFVNVHFDVDGEPVHRSYSVSCPPGGTTFTVAVSPVAGGRATAFFDALALGDVVDVSGPYGRFVLRDETPRRLILAGTGTGITPYRSMLPELSARVADGALTVEILLGVWNRDELLYSDDFLRAADSQPGLSFHACYSRAMPESPEAHEKTGYVQATIAALEPDPENDIVYLCGNPGMIDDAVDRLKSAGFPTARLRREKYLPSRT